MCQELDKLLFIYLYTTTYYILVIYELDYILVVYELVELHCQFWERMLVAYVDINPGQVSL